MKRTGHIIAIVLSLGLTLFCGNSDAELVRQPYVGIRPSGMGGAFLAVSDDNNMLWYNPAGLARVRGLHLNLIDLSFGVDSTDTLSRVQNALFKGDFDQLVRTDEEMVRVGVRPTFIAPFFGIALYDTMNGYFNLRAVEEFELLDPTTWGKKIDVYAFNDVGLNAGIGIPLGDVISIGASVRAFQRTAIDASLGAQDLLNELSIDQTNFSAAAFNALKKMHGVGLGLGLNLGTMIQVPLPKGYPRWTIAATAEDVGVTSFRALGEMPAPKRVPTTYHFGTAITYPYGRDDRLTLAMDYRNAFEPYPVIKQLYLGAEYRMKYVGLRAGLHQGYPTAGFSIEFPPHTRLHFSTFAAETGKSLWSSSQRWYLLQFVIGFNPL